AAAPAKKPIMAPALVTPQPKIALEPWPQQMFAIPEDIVTYHQPDHPAAAEYAKLFVSLEKAAATQPLAFSGAADDANVVTLVLNLAFYAAKAGSKRIVVLDADRERAPLAQATGLRQASGLHDVLAGTKALEDALLPTLRPNLHVLTARPGTELPAEALR